MKRVDCISQIKNNISILDTQCSRLKLKGLRQGIERGLNEIKCCYATREILITQIALQDKTPYCAQVALTFTAITI